MKALRHKRIEIGGLTLLEVLVVIVVGALLALALLPALAPPPRRALTIKCVSNLKQAGLAMLVWAADHDDNLPMQISTNMAGTKEFNDVNDAWHHFFAVTNELSTPRVLICPSDSRTPANNFASFANSNLSYLINLDAARSNSPAILSGDRKLTGVKSNNQGIAELNRGSLPQWPRGIHTKVSTSGNVALADGSVRTLGDADLQSLVRNFKPATNRLLMP